MKLVINDFYQNDWLLPLTAVLKGRIRLFWICFGNTAIEFNRTRTKAKHVYVSTSVALGISLTRNIVVRVQNYFEINGRGKK